MSKKYKLKENKMDTAIEKKTEIIFPISDEELAVIKEEFGIVPDCETKDGYDLTRKGISKLVKLRTTIDASRKKMTAESREYQKKVNATAAQITAELAPFEDCWKKAKLLVDNRIAEEKEKKKRAELERIKKLRDSISDIQNLVFLKPDYSSQDCLAALSVLASIEIIEDNFQELLVEAVQVHELTEYKLKDMHNAAVRRDEEAIAEQERIAKEKKQAAELAEQNWIEAEQLAEERAKYEARVAAENKERLKQEEERKKIEHQEWLKRQEAIADENKKALEERQKLDAIAEENRLKLEAEHADIRAENNRIAAKNQTLADELAEKERIAKEEQCRIDADKLKKEVADNPQIPGYEMCAQSVPVENIELESNNIRSEQIKEAADCISSFLSEFLENGRSRWEVSECLAKEIIAGNIKNITFTGAKS